MATPLMKKLHQTGVAAPWQWRLEARRARRLPAAPVTRWLAVEEGRVWLTRSQQAGPWLPEDVWLRAGERLPLPAGSEWVAEGWPEARIVLMQAADAS